MAMQAQALSGGFREPVYDSQSVFRLLMDGMARPGTVQTVPMDVDQPAPLGRAAGAAALTLCDADTPVWLPTAVAKSAVADWIVFHTGATITPDKGDAKFAFISAGSPPCSLGLFSAGTQEYPDRSTTIVIEVESLASGQPLTLSGPGIKTPLTVTVAGLPEIFPSFWADNRGLFPRGADVILTAGESLLCLPRTTTIA
jgi:alpha-D-ribose 1-methylphosphonate 5-triphosphate synthase subunit PhnH